jgi:Leucine-rich repeat (LRR) protein
MIIIYKLQGGSKNITTSDSLETIRRLYFYDGIEYLNCSNNDLSILPMLPQKLKILDCSCNSLQSLPELPHTLVTLKCESNQLRYVPVLHTGIKSVICCYNNLTFIPTLPPTLEELFCNNNELKILPIENVKLRIFTYFNNPVYDYIKDYCYCSFEIYHNENKVFANKLGSCFLKCKYNPHYKYCRDRVNSEYDILMPSE